MPVRVTIMVENFFARKFISYHIARDLSSVVLDETGSPQDLLLKMASKQPEIVVLDTDYDDNLSMGDLIHNIKVLAPAIRLVYVFQINAMLKPFGM